MRPRPTRRSLDGKRQHVSWEGWVLPFIRGGLLIVAFLMTWQGVADFITAREVLAGGAPIPIGPFSISRVSLGAGLVVGMLILTMYIALKKWIAPIVWWKRAIAGMLYVLIVLFSVGFGYGFWWGLFASKEVSDADVRAAAAQLRFETSSASERLAGVQQSIKLVAEKTRSRSDIESRVGKTCGDDSGPTRGRRAKFREEQAESLEETAKEVSADIERVKTQLTGVDEPLRAHLRRPTAHDGKEELAQLDFQLQQSARLLNQQLVRIRNNIIRRVEPVHLAFNTKRGAPNFICHDEGLARDLAAAIEEAKQPIQITVPPLPYKEGADATASAVQRLWQAIGDVIGHAWGVATLQIPWNSPLSISLFSAEAGGGRNIAAFVAAVGIDLSLLIFVLLDSRAPLDRFENVVPAAAGNRDKLLFLLETFIEKGDEEAIRFWRRCVLRVGSRAFFIAPNLDLAPPDKRPYLEAVEVLASVFSEVNGMGRASRLRFREARKRGVQRLAAWGWEAPTDRHFDLYILNNGEFREIATRLAQHKAVEPAPSWPPGWLPADSGNPSPPRPAGPGLGTLFNDAVRRGREGLALRLRPSASSATPSAAPFAPPSPAARTLVDILNEVRAPAASVRPPSGDAGDASPAAATDQVADRSLGALATSERATEPAGQQPGAGAGAEAHDRPLDRNQPDATGPAKGDTINARDVIENLHDLEVAIKAMETQNNPAFADGLAAMRRKWQASLEKNSIETFGQVGEKPHPDTHYIIGKKPSPLPAGTVAEILRSGYRKNGRVLHAADVLVSDGTPVTPATS